jgi:hypothetical protein
MNKIFSLLFICAVLSTTAHADEHEHEHEQAHEEEHEQNPAVGADKGLVEVSHENGFRLSPEALKRFKIQTLAVGSAATLTVPRTAIFTGLEERNLFRLRDGYFKRIDFKTVSRSGASVTVSSPDLKAGDQLVTNGLGFLRIAELAATGGAMKHSH